MSKELIVSVNGREKKIAILENGNVTEFYIERGEGEQGIVGNIYKGRVMRVLPGMQSAFVDIGLERDAFLYVSDFFDEEEEFERIVIDKQKSTDATRAAQERIEQARLERERQIEAAHERAEPIRELLSEDISEVVTAPSKIEPRNAPTRNVSTRNESARTKQSTREPVREALREPARETTREPLVASDEFATDGRGRRRRGRRGRGESEAVNARETGTRAVETSHDAIERETFVTPFAVGASSFERVVDEDERAVEEGEMFKDARLQERIFDQIHAVEFDMDATREATVGTLLAQRAAATESAFQRIADDDETTTPEARNFQMPVASISAFDDLSNTEGGLKTSASFERVSDEEPMTSDAGEAATVESEANEKPKRGRGRRGKADETETVSVEETTPKKRGRPSKKTGSEETSETPAPKRTRGRRGQAKDETNIGTEINTSDEVEDESLPNMEASVSGSAAHGEFARRGGRRRRKRPSTGTPNAENGATDEVNANDDDEELLAPIAAIETPAPISHGTPRGTSHATPRATTPRGTPRGTPRNGHDKRRGATTTITDLLREGQEVLVQIAKEPISQKGARITSHIALPGRFLVYMPTVEHVGVSRKIESDSERQRLRKLIQNIRATEDVPSGGFIVRTAGIGISEEDLRDDARYLVRTWRDIRRDAEKAKAAAVVHKDLDLVQRILRDQMSDDFTAIRVDSEDEYLSIVEFINRVQPRLVNRVKLYTREEPILENYGVQVELDKAIKPRVWLKSGGYLVINQTEALVAIDVNTGKFVGRGGSRLEDTITRTNLEAAEEIARQIRLRDLGGIIVLDLIDMEDRRNRQRVMQVLQEALRYDKSPTKVLSFNDFGLVIMTRKRVKQSLERTLCSPCSYCQGAGLIKSPQTICYEILEEARRISRSQRGEHFKQTTLRVNPEVVNALRTTERDVLREVEDYLGVVDLTSDARVHQEQFDFAFI